MMILLALVRGVHYAACLLVTAVWVFDLAVAGSLVRGNSPVAVLWNRTVRRLLVWGWPAAVLSGAGWFLLVSYSFEDAITPEILRLVWNGTDFGAAWRWRAICGAVAIAACVPALLLRRGIWRRAAAWLALALSAAFLAGLAWAGHGLIEPRVHLPADVLHLLAAACWPAGLVPFLLVIKSSARMPPQERLRLLAPMTRRFSALSLAAVAVLLGSGIVNACLLLRSPADFVNVPYGRLLFAKIVLFLVTVGVGAVNLRIIKPRLLAEAAGKPANGSRAALVSMARNVALETVLAAALLAIVGLLGLLPPSPP